MARTNDEVGEGDHRTRTDEVKGPDVARRVASTLRTASARVCWILAAFSPFLVWACGDNGTGVPANADPVARISAVPDRIPEGDDHRTVIQLDGSESGDPDGDAITYLWSIPEARYVDGTSAESVAPRVTLPGRVSTTVTLTVRDGRSGVGQATTAVSVEQSPLINQPPTAVLVAFPLSIPADDNHSTVVSVDATPSSDPDGDPLTYLWDVPDGRFVNGTEPSDRTIQVTFPGTDPHLVRLEVADGLGGMAQDSVFIFIM